MTHQILLNCTNNTIKTPDILHQTANQNPESKRERRKKKKKRRKRAQITVQKLLPIAYGSGGKT
jgi:hypothetical protein